MAASYGLQAGVQKFGYALFLMNDKALAYLDRTDTMLVRWFPQWTAVGYSR